MESSVSNCKVRVMMRRKLQEDEKFKVKFNVEYRDNGNSFSGSLFYKSKPKLSRVVDFIYKEIAAPQAMMLNVN